MKHGLISLNRFFSAWLAGVALFAFSFPAEATTRKVYFNQSGRNVSDKGMGTSAQSSCRITISNPSSQSQTYTLNITASITGTSAAAPTASTSETCAYVSSTGTTSTFSCSATLAASATVNKTIVYPAFPANTPGVQTMICAGYVEAVDAGSTPGFLAASGNLITFTESGSVDTTASTGSTTFNGYAIYTQLPIQINRGKPF